MEPYIKIDRYDARVINGKVHYFAIIGKKEIEMPEYYKDMYDNKHLAIRKKTMVFPEMFETTEEHYIPLNTEITCLTKNRRRTPNSNRPRSRRSRRT